MRRPRGWKAGVTAGKSITMLIPDAMLAECKRQAQACKLPLDQWASEVIQAHIASSQIDRITTERQILLMAESRRIPDSYSVNVPRA